MKTILVADDNATNRFLLTELLRMLRPSARVLACQDGVEAEREALAQRPDLIFMDLQMPVRDGLEATRALRAHPAGFTSPIIACTASSYPGERTLCQEAGMDDFLAKPVSVADLERVLATWLDARSKVQ